MAFKMNGWSAFTKDNKLDIVEKDGKRYIKGYEKEGYEIRDMKPGEGVTTGTPPNPAKAAYQIGKGIYKGGKWLYDKLKN